MNFALSRYIDYGENYSPAGIKAQQESIIAYRPTPALIYVTTGEARIDQSILTWATNNGVVVIQRSICDRTTTALPEDRRGTVGVDDLQFGYGIYLNPEIFVDRPAPNDIATGVPPGYQFTFSAYNWKELVGSPLPGGGS